MSPINLVRFNHKHLGHPYTLNAFNHNYHQALKRIGLKPCKADGLSPHSHRHSYGRRLRRAGVDEIVIKKCLHHASLDSQIVYTTPSIKEVTASLNAATFRLLNPTEPIGPIGTSSWEVLTEYGFHDIDPSGLFTGKYPKLGKCHDH